MMRKFWFTVALSTPRIKANVMVVVARMMHVRFFRNSAERNLFGSTYLMAMMFSAMASVPYINIKRNRKVIILISHCELTPSKGVYLSVTESAIFDIWNCMLFMIAQ